MSILPYIHSDGQGNLARLALPQRANDLVDLLSYGVATGHVWLIARAWLALERDVRCLAHHARFRSPSTSIKFQPS